MLKSIFNISITRLFAIIIKEINHMRRDRVTIGMLVSIPLIQLILFGFAVNTNPKNLPTAIISYDHSEQTREIIAGIQNTNYFKIIPELHTQKQLNKKMRSGELAFIIEIPPNFTRDLIKNNNLNPPEILIITDGSDPTTISNASHALQYLLSNIFKKSNLPKIKVINHTRYNPEGITQYNIVPGLIGVILTMTLVMVTGLAITREFELGTMESLLATPIKPIEIILGKITPYIFMGYIQLLIVIGLGMLLFHIPLKGSIWTLLIATFPFIFANLAVGITFSTIARNQLQAMQMTFFFFLPSLLLSGFMFPFYGMPIWAQYIGKILPLTYFLRIVRGIVLKGTTLVEVWTNIWPILIFMFIMIIICTLRFHRTLD